jgi:adenylate cyclase
MTYLDADYSSDEGITVRTEQVKRRLAAVLAGTLARLKAVRKTLVDPTIASHSGRIVKTTGDGMLVEFASAVDALRSAVQGRVPEAGL